LPSVDRCHRPASDARKSDESVPELKIAVLRNHKKKKAKVVSGTNAAGVAAEKPTT
jgi:hypothetical protein